MTPMRRVLVRAQTAPIAFLGSLLLLGLLFLGVFGPGWDHADHARVGDGLAQVLGAVADDEKQNAAFRVLAAEPVHAFFEIGVGHGGDGLLGVRVGIFQRGDDFRFVGGGLLQAL